MHGIIQALPWFAWVAIIAIVGGCITSITRMCMRHRERMAMITQGMHPDNKNAIAAPQPKMEEEVV